MKNITVGIILLLCSTSSALAQSVVLSPQAEQQALEIGTLIVTKNLVTEPISSTSELDLSNKSPANAIRDLLHHTHGIATLSNSLNPDEILKTYEQIISKHGNERDKAVFDLYKLYLTTVDLSNTQKNTYPNLTKTLSAKTRNEDWFIANAAWRLLAVRNSQTASVNLPLALEQAQNAYKIIPNEASTYVTDARILTLEQTTFLHNLLLNPELAIENTAELIKQKQDANYPIDGSSLLNNLIYSLSEWREYDVSTKLAKDVLELEKKFDSNVPGLAELRVSRLLNGQGKFSEALPLLENGLANVERTVIRKNLSLAQIIALAGLGRTVEAEKKLELVLSKYYEDSNGTNDTKLDAAKAAIAIANGSRAEAFRLTTAVNDVTAQSLLRRYSDNTSELLASLENSKTRQAEREAGLKRETNLQKSKAEQKARVNQLLMALVALLSLAALSAVIFARYRDKVSKQLAIKTLEAEDADRIKSEFLGMVSHELRTPLNGIVGIADLLTMQAPTPDLRHKAGIILDSSNKLTHVIESIVDMSIIDGNKMILYPEPTNVHEIVTELEEFWRSKIESKDVIFTSYIENSLSEDLIIDKARLRQCLNSLLSNAAKFTESGRVHLHMTAKSIDSTDETEITAIIADTGQGMSKAVQDKLFTPFLQADSTMTRKHGGSGLGLSITQSLARMMGGDVTMVSNQGRGSEFTFTVRGEKSDAAKLLDNVEELLDMIPSIEMDPALPKPSVQVPEHPAALILGDRLIPEETNYAPIELASDTPSLSDMKTVDIEINAPAARAEAPRGSVTDSLRGLKVLIVEDISANQDIIKLFLGPEGCQSLCAENGIKALEILNTQDIDIILMDIRMPEMDGIEATRAIRGSNREYKDTPIIALTADASAETNAACMAAGADIFLTKPIMARELIESIRFVHRFQGYDEDGVVSAA